MRIDFINNSNETFVPIIIVHSQCAHNDSTFAMHTFDYGHILLWIPNKHLSLLFLKSSSIRFKILKMTETISIANCGSGINLEDDLNKI